MSVCIVVFLSYLPNFGDIVFVGFVFIASLFKQVLQVTFSSGCLFLLVSLDFFACTIKLPLTNSLLLFQPERLPLGHLCATILNSFLVCK